MPPPKILDSHIHLWPATATSSTNHSWMTPGHHLSKRHSITDYNAICTPNVAGFVYVETDRFLPSPKPDLGDDVRDWAKEPLSEIAFLRRIVEGAPQEGDGFLKEDAGRMKGAVVYAPLHLEPEQLERYFEAASDVAGEGLWERVVGVRYLLQGKEDGEVERLLGSEGWMRNVLRLREGRGGKGWVCDVGIDTHRDGVSLVEVVGRFIKEVRKKENDDGKGHVRFVLNHLCKPPLSEPASKTYLNALTSLSADENVFMKLSGAFNEFSKSPDPATTPSSPSSFLEAATPFLDHAFDCFPGRVMFGSDWPVCNVGGPKGESGNWKFWVEVVEEYLARKEKPEQAREDAWWRAGVRAYGVEL